MSMGSANLSSDGKYLSRNVKPRQGGG